MRNNAGLLSLAVALYGLAACSSRGVPSSVQDLTRDVDLSEVGDGDREGAALHDDPADRCASPPTAPAIGPFKTYPGDCVLSYRLEGEELAKLAGEYDSTKVTGELTSLLRDEIDFVTLVFDQPYGNNPLYVGSYHPAQACSTTDCPRRLGTLHLAFNQLPEERGGGTSIRSGPVLHELMHQWANMGAIPNASDRFHWGFASTGGQLGGWEPDSLQDLGGGRWFACAPAPRGWPDWRERCAARDPSSSFGRFANRGNSVPYSPIELWSMGLLADDELPAVTVSVDPVDEREDGQPFTGVFRASGFRTLSAADLRANLVAAGAPLPATAKARRSFRMVTVVLTGAAELPAAFVDALNRDLAAFAARGEPDDSPTIGFFTATRGRARLSVGGVSTYAK